MSEKSLVDVIGDYCHIDGPHDRDTVLDAARSISELVRYLNHATQGPAAERTLAWANTIYGVLSNLSAAAHGTDQLLRQLVSGLERQVGNPGLYDDRHDRAGAQTAHDAAAWIGAGQRALGEFVAYLDSARDLAVHLGNND